MFINNVTCVIGFFLMILLFIKRNEYEENFWVFLVLFLPIIFFFLKKVLDWNIYGPILFFVGFFGILFSIFYGLRFLIKTWEAKKRNKIRLTIAKEGISSYLIVIFLSVLSFWKSIELFQNLGMR